MQYIDRSTKIQDMLKKNVRKTNIYTTNKLAKEEKDKTVDFGEDLQGLGKGFNKLHKRATVPAFSSMVHLL